MTTNFQTLMLLVVLQNVILLGLVIGLYYVGVLVSRIWGGKASFSLAPLGFTKPRSGYLGGVGTGVLVGILAYIGSLFVGGITAVVLRAFGYSAENQAQEPLLRGLQSYVQENPVAAISLAVLVIVIFGPAVEELVFRGAIFNGLYRLGRRFSRRVGDSESHGRRAEVASFAAAALMSSVVFSLLHLSPVILPSLFILALVLCWLFRRSGSLIPPFVAHATFNSFTTILLILSALGYIPSPG